MDQTYEEGSMYKIAFFVPAEYLEEVKQAMFLAGAGKIGEYDQCCWQIEGQGQFRPMANSNPFLGEKQMLSRVKEFKVEMMCESGCIKPVIAAMKQVHPYETPAYDVFEVIDI